MLATALNFVAALAGLMLRHWYQMATIRPPTGRAGASEWRSLFGSSSVVVGERGPRSCSLLSLIGVLRVFTGDKE
jgi:hypothetical protein